MNKKLLIEFIGPPGAGKTYAYKVIKTENHFSIDSNKTTFIKLLEIVKIFFKYKIFRNIIYFAVLEKKIRQVLPFIFLFRCLENFDRSNYERMIQDQGILHKLINLDNKKLIEQALTFLKSNYTYKVFYFDEKTSILLNRRKIRKRKHDLELLEKNNPAKFIDIQRRKYKKFYISKRRQGFIQKKKNLKDIINEINKEYSTEKL